MLKNRSLSILRIRGYLFSTAEVVVKIQAWMQEFYEDIDLNAN